MSVDSVLFIPYRERPLFFSSTFRDMHAERDKLRGDTFLILNERLKSRHHHLNVIDLRQGLETADIEDESARELKVLQVCLDEVKRSRPFLIGLIGDRYGWIPPEENMRAAARSAGFDGDVVGKSVTELELLYGMLADPEQQLRSRAYIREMDYTGMADDVRAVYDERYAKDPDAPERWEKLQELKKRLKKEFPDRVRTYTGLDQLHQFVLEDLGADLDAETSQYEQEAPKSWQESDERELNDFVLDRLRHFVERPAVTEPALANATGADESGNWGLCLSGESGLGKSAIFASLYRELKSREENGELLVLAHAAGISASSGQVDRMLRRWVHELAEFLQIEDPLESIEQELSENDEKDRPRIGRLATDDDGETRGNVLTSEKIDETFHSLLGQASVRTRIVLLVDALNQFDRTIRARNLTWLPKLWSDNLRFVATAIPGDETESLTRDRRLVEIRPIPSIDREEARAIAHRVFRERYHREPNAAALDVLLDKQQSSESGARPAHGNALWFELALQESNLLEGDDFARAEAKSTLR